LVLDTDAPDIQTLS
jgi:hypothetical protein